MGGTKRQKATKHPAARCGVLRSKIRKAKLIEIDYHDSANPFYIEFFFASPAFPTKTTIHDHSHQSNFANT